jgi:hypothetical protein
VQLNRQRVARRCGAGCNSPIFADIVPPAKRSLIYAFDRCFEGALAACAAPLVGIVAQRAFGYDASAAERVGNDHASPAAARTQASNARALGESLMYCLAVPWSLCFLFYFGLHRSYPADRARLKQIESGSALASLRQSLDKDYSLSV